MDGRTCLASPGELLGGFLVAVPGGPQQGGPGGSLPVGLFGECAALQLEGFAETAARLDDRKKFWDLFGEFVKL